MRQGADVAERSEFPGWVPDAVFAYLEHTTAGCSIRALARRAGCHPSTVLRQVRRIEIRRDDHLVDAALQRLSGGYAEPPVEAATERTALMTSSAHLPDDDRLKHEGRRILRRLAEPGACLALADGMENAVVVRDGQDGKPLKTAVVDRAVAEAMALRDWIGKHGSGRVLRYHITPAGRAMLKRLLAEEESRRAGAGDAIDAYGDQHRSYGHRAIADESGKKRRMRFNLAESPLLALSRRRDKSGTPFLSEALVEAGERLREDFELAQMGPRITQNWDRFLTAGARQSLDAGDGPCAGPVAARRRVMDALGDLGPGLGDVALRCCCFLEGLELAEKRMGWSARSGKIVLRIALQRLHQHYAGTREGAQRMIG